MEKIVVNVAWPYANGPIHVGHVAGSLLGPDIFARYHRMKGNSVLMVSGSDQHGTAITLAAEKERTTPAELSERYHRINAESIEWLKLSFDIYTKTHTENHFSVVQEFFKNLERRGYFYLKKTNQYYCVSDGRFLADTYVYGKCPRCGYEEAKGNQCEMCGTVLEPGDLLDARCTICRNPVVLRETENVFFALSRFSGALLEYLKDKDYWRSSVLEFTRNWLVSGLNDRAVTRDLDWGIPAPMNGMEGKVIYVWFEAVIGYLSASIEWARRIGREDAWKEYWQGAARHFYFMGKDNIPFHSIIWPAMLMGHGGLSLPYQIVANQYMNAEDRRKFSKSRGGAVTIASLRSQCEPDQLRYYIAATLPEHHDTFFSFDDMEQKVNGELVATLGNYYHRVLSFAQRNFGIVAGDEDHEMLREAEATATTVASSIEACEFKKGLKAVMDLAQKGNQFFDRCAPWASLKTDREKCRHDIYINLEVVRRLAIISFPYLPDSSIKILSYLGIWNGTYPAWESVWKRVASYSLLIPSPVFSKLSIKKEGHPLELRAGKIVSVSKHPNAEKLYLLEVDIGERRQIVAGLRDYYSESELLGKRVVVVANLQPAKLRGFESNGMLLAAEKDGKVRLLTVDGDAPTGTLDGFTGIGTRLNIDAFRKYELRIAREKDGKLSFEEGEGEEVAVIVEDTGARKLTIAGRDVKVDGSIGAGAKIR